MIKSSFENDKILFHYEVLRARLEIREFFLKTTVKEVYENIGQVLSVVRMQLAYLEPTTINKSVQEINSSGDLIGQTIRDLRVMCRSFYPDEDILKTGGFIEALENTLRLMEFGEQPKVKVKGTEAEITPGLKLIIFKIVQEILASAKDVAEKFRDITISYTSDAFKFTLAYIGNNLNFNGDNNSGANGYNLTIRERIRLINGDIKVKKSKAANTCVILKTPLNTLYE